MSGVTVAEQGVVTGNTYDKYGSTNPVVRRLMANFERALDQLLDAADPSSLLDVGCGEGVLIHRWALRLPERRVVGIDLQEESIQAGWSARQAPNLEYLTMPAENLPFAANEFGLASAIEVLWRLLNAARGAYWSELGNTPGHLNHWSKRSFHRLLSRHGEVIEVRSPFPWTMLLVRL